ncbi:hypothetical protein MKZ38_005372 [Zalerion maritima]|uniref:MOSC domain-containing protein n=1 Tax=Zalerion maritima TaxID=339359 RepID=A0AAD5RXQ9_9PEZI|nr:hypothetical protein MKZ38_005372 [Zalerion maritima]
MGYLEDTASELIANGTLPQPDGSFSLFEFSSVVILSITIVSFILPVLIIYPPVPATESDALNVTHRKLGVEPSKSGLNTQYSKSKSNVPRLHSLWVYPVKSCAGIELSSSRVLPTGLQHDRLFMFAQLRSPFPVSVDATEKEKSGHTWEMVAMRQFARMANVDVDIWVPDEAKLRGKLNPEDRPTESYMVIRFPWKDDGWRGALQLMGAKLKWGASAQPHREILLPLEYPSKEEVEAKGYEMEPVKIWKDTVKALNMQCEVPEELQRYLGVSNKLTLFRLNPNMPREVHRNAPTKNNAGYQPIVGFQDAASSPPTQQRSLYEADRPSQYPLNILSLSSIQDLEEKIQKDDTIEHIDLRRFRANVIFKGAPPYDEETWKKIQMAPEDSADVTKASFDVCCRCVRCKLPNVDPNTGIRHNAEPDHTLRKFRNVDAGAPRLGCMAMQLVPLFELQCKVEDMESWLEVGMPIQITERGKHLYEKM